MERGGRAMHDEDGFRGGVTRSPRGPVVGEGIRMLGRRKERAAPLLRVEGRVARSQRDVPE